MYFFMRQFAAGSIREYKTILFGILKNQLRFLLSFEVCNIYESRSFEVKQGPYDPETSLLFAPWSPVEGSAQVKAFQAKLFTTRVGDQVA